MLTFDKRKQNLKPQGACGGPRRPIKSRKGRKKRRLALNSLNKSSVFPDFQNSIESNIPL